MATTATRMELHSADRRRSKEPGRDPGNVNVTPQGEALKKIASLPRTRQDKVLDVRRQIAEGTYKVGERLEEAMDRVLEALTP